MRSTKSSERSSATGSEAVAEGTLPRGMLLLLAVTAGTAVANLYYAQPLLVDMAHDLHRPASVLGSVPGMTQLGYAVGLALLVPLGDVFARRRLMNVLLLLAAVALAAVAAAPSVGALATTSLLLGLVSVTPQIALPYAAALVAPGRRGRVVGTVMTGLLVGVLLARTVSGLLGTALGWRAVFALAAVAMLALAAVLHVRLPEQRPTAALTYRQVLASMPRLVREEPALRRIMVYGMLAYGVFSMFWTALTAHLAAAPLHRGATVAGLYGLVGVGGAVAAPLIGRLADRGHGRAAAGIGMLVVLASFGVFWLGRVNLIGLAIGVVLLDLGLNSLNTTNLQRIYTLRQDVGSRVNSVYITSLFLAQAAGSALATTLQAHYGWAGVCLPAAIAMAVALVFWATARRQPTNQAG